jgi:lipid A 3-O-deacylase
VRVCGPWSTVWIAALAAAFVYLAAAPSAKSEDLLAPTPTPGGQIEVRFGAFDHGVGSAEHNTVDINGSVLTPRLNLGVSGYWAYLLPRFQVGGAVNLAGRTSFYYSGIALTLPITQGLFFEPFVGAAVHDGSLHGTPLLSALGCPALFRAGASIGVSITEHWKVVGTFEHLSNGKGIFGVNCGTNQDGGDNQGLNNYGLSVGYAF